MKIRFWGNAWLDGRAGTGTRHGTLELQRRLAGSLREHLVTQLQPKPDEAQQDPEPKGHLPCCRTVSEMADDDQHDATRTEDVLRLDRSYTSSVPS